MNTVFVNVEGVQRTASVKRAVMGTGGVRVGLVRVVNGVQ
jgi:hypothetical protein